MRLHILALLTILAAAWGSVSIAGQTLADVARKEEERRKSVKEPGKTYTNKDLAGLPIDRPLPPPPATASTSTDASAAKEPEKPAEKEPAKDQAYWAGRLKELQTELRRDQTYADALTTRLNSLATDFVNRDDPAQRAVIAKDREEAQAELDRLKKAIEQHKKAIAALEDEARRANVPPGWLR
jgi:hypothetical protein